MRVIVNYKDYQKENERESACVDSRRTLKRFRSGYVHVFKRMAKKDIEET